MSGGGGGGIIIRSAIRDAGSLECVKENCKPRDVPKLQDTLVKPVAEWAPRDFNFVQRCIRDAHDRLT